MLESLWFQMLWLAVLRFHRPLSGSVGYVLQKRSLPCVDPSSGTKRLNIFGPADSQ
jgi:hypothetical protein